MTSRGDIGPLIFITPSVLIMLEALRKRSGSLIVKLMLALLVLSFAAWGVGDMINRAAAPDAAAMVGETTITPQQLQIEYRRDMNRLRQQLGPDFGPEQARQFKVMDAVLGRIINTKLFEESARDMGVVVSDKQVLDEIKATPAFAGITKEFDRGTFQQVLANAGLSENEYIAIVRADLKRRPLVKGIERGISVPDDLFKKVYAYRQEKRQADMLLLATEEMPEPAAPSEEDLKAFYKDNEPRFTAPEYRKVTVASLNLETLAKGADITQDAITESYESRISEFKTAEKREVQQMVFGSKDEANAAHQRLSNGEDFAKIAKELLDMDEDSLSLGLMTRAEMPSALADAAFAIPQGGFSVPVETPLGWHVIRVAKKERERQQSLEEASESIKKDLAREWALETLFQKKGQLEDELAGGSTIQEAASAVGMALVTIPSTDASGQDPEGKAATQVPDMGEVLKTAFATEPGIVSQVIETATDGMFVLKVESITPPALRSFETVRDQALEGWKLQTRAEAAKAEAEAIRERLTKGEKIADISKEKAIPLETPEAFLRTGGTGAGNAPLPQALVKSVFDSKKGEAVVAQAQDGYYVAVVKDVIVPTVDESDVAVMQARGELKKAVASDLMMQLTAGLRGEFPVRINRQVVNSIQ